MIGPRIVAQDYIELMGDGKLFDVLYEVFVSALPEPLVALLVFGPIGIGYYLVQQRVVIPMVMFLIIGGVTISRAPAAYNGAIIAAFALALAGVGYFLLNRVRVR